MPYPTKAKANIDAGLKRIREKKPGVAVHFLIARPAGPRDTPRVIFARRADLAMPAQLKAAYTGDGAVKDNDPSKWFTVRGVAVLNGDVWQILPASRGSKVVDPSAMKVQFRDLKVALNANSVLGAAVDPLIEAAVGRATDTSRIVDTTPVDGDEPVEEDSEPVVEHSEAEVEAPRDPPPPPEDEEEAPPPPKNELAVEDVPEDTALAGVKELAAQFATIDLRTARGLRAAAGVDAVQRLAAHTQLGLVRDSLLDLAARGRKLIANVSSVSAARPVALVKEIIRRVESAILWLEEDMDLLVAPNPDIAAVSGQKDDPSLVRYPKVAEWVAQVEALLREADVVLRGVANPGQIQELGQMLHSRDLADASIAKARLKEINSLGFRMASVHNCIQGELTSSRKTMRAAHAPLKVAGAALASAKERVQALPDEISAAGLAIEGEDANRGKRATVRQKIISELTSRPDVIKRLVAIPGGPKQIDDMVADLQGKAGTEGDRAFVKAAIEARFRCKLTGDLTTKALPRMYSLFKLVPETHTTQNQFLGTVNRTKIKTKMSGSYANSTLELSVGKTGWNAEKSTLGQTGTQKKILAFDHVTLHELGHAVDAKKTFMATHMAGVKYGNWKTETPASVAVVVDQHFKLDVDVAFTPFNEADRRKILEHVLNEEEGKADTLAGVAWATVKTHAALVRCRALRKTSKGGQWHPGAAAASVIMNTRIYQEAYAGQWWSYPSTARDDKVSDYQFRAPGEWFAEIYTAYYTDALKVGDPVHTWFEAEVDL
jgi:hypothetical protein